MAEHTPGPWRAVRAETSLHHPKPRGWEVRGLRGPGNDLGSPVTGWGAVTQTEADARLIAAAPRMADYIRLHAERDPEARAILQEAGVLPIKEHYAICASLCADWSDQDTTGCTVNHFCWCPDGALSYSEFIAKAEGREP